MTLWLWRPTRRAYSSFGDTQCYIPILGELPSMGDLSEPSAQLRMGNF